MNSTQTPAKNAPQAATTQAERSPLMTRDEVRKYFGISDMTVHRWIKSGALPPPLQFCGGGHCRWLRADIAQIVAARASARRA